MQEDSPSVLYERSGAVCTITLNRPQALNSFTRQMHEQLRSALCQAADDREVRCVVLTGAGRAFCSGQDLSDEGAAPAPAGQPPTDLSVLIERYYGPLCEQLRSMPVPVIAAVNGVAAGAGANVALCCDLVVAAESASFIQAFTKIGLVPDSGGTWILPRLVGRQRALGLALLGDKLPAAEAERMGLIWRCVAAAEFPAEVEALAQRLAAKLGFARATPEVSALADDWLALLARERTDYTVAWRRLARHAAGTAGEPLHDLFIDRAACDAWLLRFQELLAHDPSAHSPDLMLKSNPVIVLRNHLAEQAIEQARRKNFGLLAELQAALEHPYDEPAAHPEWAGIAPDWAAHIQISCSS